MMIRLQHDLISFLLRGVLLGLIWAKATRGQEQQQQQQQQQQLELTASSPFAMILQPIISDNGKVPLSGLQFLEEATATTLFEEQPTGNIYLDMEAVIQQVDYFNDEEDNGSSAAATTTGSTSLTRLVKIRFFVLATVVADVDESSSLTPRLELNQLVKTVLVDSVIGKNQFLQVLQSSNHTSLQNVSSVLVSPWSSAPTVPAPTAGNQPTQSSSNNRRLSTLDIALITASGLIFVGIMYMIVQHHYDRGYIENQRVLAFNRRMDGGDEHDDDHATHHSHPRSPRTDKPGRGDGSVSSRSHAPGLSHGATNTTLDGATSDEAPSTPSTMYSTTDLQQPHQHPQGGDLRTPERRPSRITNVDNLRSPASSVSSSASAPGIMNTNAVNSNALLMTPKALLTASSLDGASIQSISESFDGQWFQTNVMDVDEEDDDIEHNRKVVEGSVDKDHNENNDEKEENNDEDNNENEDKQEDNDENEDDESSSDTSDGSEVSDSTESSEDVFCVDVEAASAAGKSKASSHASAAAISEWMKTIRVVGVRHHHHHQNTHYANGGQYQSSSDTKTSDMTHSSYGEALSSSVSSSPPRGTSGGRGGGDDGDKLSASNSPVRSLTQTSLDVASLEHLSLEQSMASSNIVPDDITTNVALEV